MSTYPDNLGIIGMGGGKAVFPAPAVDADWNPLIRGYQDGAFRFHLITGLTPDPEIGWQFVEPASYRIEITPDLGWPNPEELFQPYTHGSVGGGNSLLRIFRDITVDDMEVLSDETGTYTIPESELRKILAPGFERYLWRVMAVSPAGHTGHPSGIQSFRGRVLVVNLAWTVRDPDSPARSVTTTISGTRESFVRSIEVNGEAGWTTFPTPTTWRAEVPLGRGRNVFFLRAFDENGYGSEYRSVEVEMTAGDLATRTYFNRFDDFGYKMGLKRLPEELNHAYRERIKDVMVHRAGPSYGGICNGIVRELGLTSFDQALLVRPATNPLSQSVRWGDVSVWMTSRHFYVRRSTFTEIQERTEVEGRSLQVRPAKFASGPSFLVEQEPGVQVTPDKYRVLADKDGPYIQFYDVAYSGRRVYITYQYATRITFYDKTISELVAELNALTVNGQQVIEVEMSPDVTGTWSARGLQKFPPMLLGSGPYYTVGSVECADFPVRWSPFELAAFTDPEFRERFRNANGSFFGTEYSAWAYGLKSKLKTTWGYIVADASVWSSRLIRVSGAGGLDLVYDSWRAVWESSAGGYELDPFEAAVRGYLDPRDGSRLRFRGLPWSLFWSGIGYHRDLLSIVDEEAATVESEAEEFEIVRQLVEGDVASFEDLGIGQNEVDSSSEVSV